MVALSGCSWSDLEANTGAPRTERLGPGAPRVQPPEVILEVGSVFLINGIRSHGAVTPLKKAHDLLEKDVIFRESC